MTKAGLARAAVAGAVAALTPACHGAGPYGYAPRYVELADEGAASKGARDYDPVAVQRSPEEWRKGTVSLFGVVDARSPGPGGQALLRLTVRRLEPRNACEREHDDDSCRVTVSDKDFGVVWALASLRGDDDVGPKAVGPRSLVRVVGRVGQDMSPTDGAPVVHAAYYRHFPPPFYVTRASAQAERR
jgi:hypothetical protein